VSQLTSHTLKPSPNHSKSTKSTISLHTLLEANRQYQLISVAVGRGNAFSVTTRNKRSRRHALLPPSPRCWDLAACRRASHCTLADKTCSVHGRLFSPENSFDHSDSSDTAAQAGYSLYDEPLTNNGNMFSISEHDPLHIDIVDLPTFCASDAAPLTSIRSDRDSGCSSGCWWSPDPKRAASKYCPTHTPVRRHHTATGRQQHSLQRALHLNSSLSEGGPLMSLPSSSSSSASSSLLLSPASGRHPKPAWSDDSFRHADSRVGPPGSCSKEGTLDGCKRQQLLTQLLVAAPDQFPFSGSADGLACIAEEVHEETRSGSKLFDVGDDDDGQHRNGHDKCDDCGGDGDILKN